MKGHEIEEALSFEILDSKGLLNIFCGVVLDDVFFGGRMGGGTLLKKRCLKGRKFRNLRRQGKQQHNHQSGVQFCAAHTHTCLDCTTFLKEFLYF